MNTQPDVHALVKNYFQGINLQSLFLVAREQFDKKQAKRTFTGRHATARLLRAQAKRKKAEKRIYFPEKLVL